MKVISYDIFLDLDFKNLRFNGKVRMDLESGEDVTLNALGLGVEGVSCGQRVFKFEHKDGNLIVKTGPFKGVLQVEFHGSILDILVGIYRAPYDQSYVVTTQFEAAHARRMFPCFDHPAYKAEFKLSLKIDLNLDAISNMPIASVEVEGDKKIISFQKTPKMSTYLLYLGVGRFGEVKDKLDTLDIIVATAPEKVDKGRFALDMAKKCISFYHSYFQISYTLPKLHLISVPEFAAGAMENWGAITFRETALLISDKSSIRAKKNVSEIIAHEIAHMWFGDLVTMKWWDDLWLNESFATFISHKAVDAINPEWNIWKDFLRNTSGAMSRDSLRNTHPIKVHIEAPEEIEQIFDEISYDKGANILRMIESYMGANDFREGLKKYLKRYEFSNATGDDFWNILEEVSGKHIKRIMSEWIKKPGYPLVTVEKSGGELTMKQERFLLSGEADEDAWPIPLTMKQDGEVRKLLFDKREETVQIGDAQSMKLNVDRTGFYRVYYKGLYNMVWKSDLSAYDRWEIIFDAFAFLLAGKMSFTEYLNVGERYLSEQDYLPTLEVSDQLSWIYSIKPEKITKFSKSFHKSHLKQLQGKTDENSSMLRGIIATRLAMIDKSYGKKLGLRFHELDQTEPNMKDAVAIAYARAYSAFEEIISKYRASESDEDKVRLLTALACFREESLTALSLGLALSGDVKRQDVSTILLTASRNPNAREITWKWLKLNFEKLRKFYEGTGNLSRILLSAIPMLGIGKVEETNTFFEQNMAPEAEKGIKAGLERLKIYDKFVKRL
jgi:tricorn protease interacting factor F2/3